MFKSGETHLGIGMLNINQNEPNKCTGEVANTNYKLISISHLNVSLNLSFDKPLCSDVRAIKFYCKSLHL